MRPIPYSSLMVSLVNLLQKPAIQKYISFKTPHKVKLSCRYGKCSTPQTKYFSYEALAEHMDEHVLQDNFMPEFLCGGHDFCEACPYSVLGFRTAEEKIEHRKCRQCPNCLMIFSRSDNLTTHLRKKGDVEFGSACEKKMALLRAKRKRERYLGSVPLTKRSGRVEKHVKQERYTPVFKDSVISEFPLRDIEEGFQKEEEDGLPFELRDPFFNNIFTDPFYGDRPTQPKIENFPVTPLMKVPSTGPYMLLFGDQLFCVGMLMKGR